MPGALSISAESQVLASSLESLRSPTHPQWLCRSSSDVYGFPFVFVMKYWLGRLFQVSLCQKSTRSDHKYNKQYEPILRQNEDSSPKSDIAKRLWYSLYSNHAFSWSADMLAHITGTNAYWGRTFRLLSSKLRLNFSTTLSTCTLMA